MRHPARALVALAAAALLAAACGSDDGCRHDADVAVDTTGPAGTGRRSPTATPRSR